MAFLWLINGGDPNYLLSGMILQVSMVFIGFNLGILGDNLPINTHEIFWAYIRISNRGTLVGVHPTIPWFISPRLVVLYRGGKLLPTQLFRDYFHKPWNKDPFLTNQDSMESKRVFFVAHMTSHLKMDNWKLGDSKWPFYPLVGGHLTLERVT